MLRGHSSETARKIFGISQRCLDHWIEKGIIKPIPNQDPDLKRPRRRYSFDELVRIGLVVRLRQANVGLDVIRDAIDELRKTRRGRSAKALIIDGSKARWRRADGKIEDLVSKGQLLFAFALPGVERDVQTRLANHEKETRRKTRSQAG